MVTRVRDSAVENEDGWIRPEASSLKFVDREWLSIHVVVMAVRRSPVRCQIGMSLTRGFSRIIGESATPFPNTQPMDCCMKRRIGAQVSPGNEPAFALPEGLEPVLGAVLRSEPGEHAAVDKLPPSDS